VPRMGVCKTEILTSVRVNGIPQWRQFGEPLLKKREKWRTPGYFGQC